MLRCAVCGEERRREEYTKTQLKKHGKRRCKACTTDTPLAPPPPDLLSELHVVATEVLKIGEGLNQYERVAVAAFVDHEFAQPRLELKTIGSSARPSPLPDDLSTLAATAEARHACEVMRPVFGTTGNCVLATAALFQALDNWCRRKSVRCWLVGCAIVPPWWITLDSGEGEDPGDSDLWQLAGRTADGRRAYEHRLLKFEGADGRVVFFDATASQVGFDSHACVFDGKLPAQYLNVQIAKSTTPTDPVVNGLLIGQLHAAPEFHRPRIVEYWKGISALCANL